MIVSCKLVLYTFHGFETLAGKILREIIEQGSVEPGHVFNDGGLMLLQFRYIRGTNQGGSLRFKPTGLGRFYFDKQDTRRLAFLGR